MIEIKTKLRKWGNSLGVVVPLNSVKTEHMHEGEEVTIIISKAKNNLNEAFGSLKEWKIDTQKFKDENRKVEWEKEEKERK